MKMCPFCNNKMTELSDEKTGVTYTTNTVVLDPMLALRVRFYVCNECGYIARFAIANK